MKKFRLKCKNFYQYIFILLILAVSVVNLRYFFQPGIFRGHDVENHLARIANYYLAVKDGHIPPRWAKNLNHKFGYPVFNYNYPLANIFGYPLIVAGFGIEDTLKIILFSAYFLSGLFFYLWLKRHFSHLSALVGSFVYLCAPYQFLDLYVRGVVGENLSFALLPAVLYFLKILSEKLNKWRFLGLVLLTAFFSLSHNIMVLIFVPLIFAYWYYLSWSPKFNFRKIGLVGLFLGFLATSFFWIPAFLERNYVTLNAFDPKTFYQDHFVYPKQLFYDKWQYGFSTPGFSDTMSFQVGLIHWFIVLVSAIILIGQYVFKRDRVQKRTIISIFWHLVFWLAIFFMLSISEPVWKILPLMGFLQFPWRLLSVCMFSTAVLAAFLVESINYKIFAWFLIFVSLISCQQFTKPFLWEKKSDMVYYDFLFTTSVRHENMPVWFWEGKTDRLKSRFYFEGGPVTFREFVWRTGEHIYEVNAQQESYIFEHTAYFPGWQVFVDGQKAKIETEHQEYPGLIRFRVPEGRHRIVVKFTEKTAARIIGDCLTVIALTSILAVLSFLRKP